MNLVLIHWNVAEGERHTLVLGRAGFQAKLEADPRDGPRILRRLRAAPPDALAISLDRLPMQGRDVGLALRSNMKTRPIPLVFVGGEADKVDRVRRALPDAIFTTWPSLARAVKRGIANPRADPVAPASVLAGYSGTPLPKKLGIKPNACIALIEEPEGFAEILDPLPPGVEFSGRLTSSTAVGIWFVRSAAELASKIDSVAGQVREGKSCRLWIAWAKRTSPLAGDVNENLVRTAALAAGLVDYKVAAIDADWSGLLFAPRTGK